MPANTQPLVSVIITAYNVQPYLAATIQSVLDQHYKTFEVIVVDDGSTDGTAEEIDRFLLDARVRALHQANCGSASARNAGARVAGGDFLAFIDGDDLATPARLLESVRAMSEHPEAALAYGSIELIDENSAPLASRKHSKRYRSGWVADQLRYRNFIPFSTITMRRTVFEQLGGFDEGVPSSEDWELLYRLTTKYQVVYVNECLVRYRIRRQSKTTDVAAKERAYLNVQRRIFVDTDKRRSLPRLAHACRLAGLASIHLRLGEPREAVLCALKSVLHNPYVIVIFQSEIWDSLKAISAGVLLSHERKSHFARLP